MSIHPMAGYGGLFLYFYIFLRYKKPSLNFNAVRKTYGGTEKDNYSIQIPFGVEVLGVRLCEKLAAKNPANMTANSGPKRI